MSGYRVDMQNDESDSRCGSRLQCAGCCCFNGEVEGRTVFWKYRYDFSQLLLDRDAGLASDSQAGSEPEQSSGGRLRNGEECLHDLFKRFVRTQYCTRRQ